MDDREWLKQELQELKDGQGELKEDVSTVLITLERQHAVLAEHQRRSLANEEAINLLRNEVKPLTIHVAMVTGIIKAVIFLGTVVGIMAGLIKLLGR